ncbi:MAG: Crp/Fnr family transcriptional regulator [Bacteroidota bacterium]
MEALKNFFSSVEHLSSKDMDFLLSKLESKKVAKGTALFELGEMVKDIYFLEDGILHRFNYNDLGEQKTLSLHESPRFCTDLESFSKAKKSTESCVAMTDCTLYRLSKTEYNSLVNSNIRWSNFVKKITEISLILELNETKNRANKPIKERYLDLVNRQPRILQNVSLQIIASYLGTSRETLHRIRRSVHAA